MAVKKSELYASLWKSCDELRGGMDASQYKDYVLVLLFMKYVSDRYAGDPDGQIFVPEGSRFGDLVALKGDKEIGDKLNKAIAALAEENDLTGVITLVDFNDPDKLGKGKEMVDRLSNLIGIFNAPGLDFSGNRAEGDDLLGDAYEFLMRHFATESGKSKGQFYTPAEVSTVMARLLGIGADTPASRSAHDPTCGSGCGRGAARADALRAGNGQRHQRAGQDEHDPARLHHGRDRERQHAVVAAVPGCGGAVEDLRLRGGQSALLQQGVEQRAAAAGRRVRPLRVGGRR